MPAHLLNADGTTAMSVLGICIITVSVPGTKSSLCIPFAVVRALFCPALLGRNALLAVDDVYGNRCVYTGPRGDLPVPRPCWVAVRAACAQGSLFGLLVPSGRRPTGVTHQSRSPLPSRLSFMFAPLTCVARTVSP